MKKTLLVLCIAVLALAACKSREVKEVDGTAVGKTKQQVEAGILAGCTDRGWICSKTQDGVVDGSVKIRGHFLIETTVSYGDGFYKIMHKNSEGLSYKESSGKKTIHKGYYKWIAYLDRSIRRELSRQ